MEKNCKCVQRTSFLVNITTTFVPCVSSRHVAILSISGGRGRRGPLMVWSTASSPHPPYCSTTPHITHPSTNAFNIHVHTPPPPRIPLSKYRRSRAAPHFSLMLSHFEQQKHMHVCIYLAMVYTHVFLHIRINHSNGQSL